MLGTVRRHALLAAVRVRTLAAEWLRIHATKTDIQSYHPHCSLRSSYRGLQRL